MKIEKVSKVPERKSAQGKWVEVLTAMKVGDIIKIQPEDGEDIKRMRSAISSSGSHIKDRLAGKITVSLHEDAVYVEMTRKSLDRGVPKEAS